MSWDTAEEDPLTAVFLAPLGPPWTQFLDHLSEATTPWSAALAPEVNLILVRMYRRICFRSA